MCSGGGGPRLRELEDLLFSPIALDSLGKCQGAAEESPGRQRGGRSCRAAGADSAVPGGGSPRDCRASLALSFRGITTGGSSFLPPLFWHETACRRHPRTMIAEFAHFYLFGFICVTSGNHLSRRVSYAGAAVAALPQPLCSLPPRSPTSAPPRLPAPSFARKRSSASTLREPGPPLPRELPPAVGDARRRVLPWSRGSHRRQLPRVH